MNGRFFTIEGGEGAGKSTQIELLAAELRSKGKEVLVTREPGGDPIAEEIRKVLLSSDASITHTAEVLLFIACRAQLTQHIIRPALDHGITVLCDRFIDSTVVYQGYARGQNIGWLRQLNQYATNGLLPDRTILLDIPPTEGLHRQQERNRMEQEALDFHTRVRNGFLSEAKLFPSRFCVIDARSDVRTVFHQILERLQEIL